MVLECYDLLKSIEQRPAMWTGETSLKSIHCYISGYYHALLDNEIVQKPHTDELFFDWVAKKFDYYESTAGWVNMILAYCMGFKPENINWEKVFNTVVKKEQHFRSIELFYKLVEQFKTEIEENSV